MSSYSRKRSRLSNIAKATQARMDKGNSSSEEIDNKREKRISTSEDEDLEDLMNQLGMEVDKGLLELNQSNANCDDLTRKLEVHQALLDTANKKIKELRAEIDAAKKREKRLRIAAAAEPVKKIRAQYVNCKTKERADRLDHCAEILEEMIGAEKNTQEYGKNRDRLLTDLVEKLGMKIKFSLDEDLQFSIMYSIPDHARESMKQFFRNHLSIDPFCSNKAVRSTRKMLCNTDEWSFVEHEDAVGCADGKKGRQSAFSYFDKGIEASITAILKSLTKNSKLNLDAPYDDVVALVLQLDKGGPLTKFGYSVSNLSEKVGSPGNFTLIGLSTLGENYNNMTIAFGDLFKQIDALNGKSMIVMESGRERTVKIRFKIGGDFKSIAMLTGHGGASSTHYCPKCTSTKTVMKSWNTRCPIITRSNSILGELNISKLPLIRSIKADDIVIPVNHVLTGITKKAMAVLGKMLNGESTEWCEEKDEQLQDINKLISIASGSLQKYQEMKKQVMTVHDATRSMASNRIRGTSEVCSKFCLFNVVIDGGLPWDTIPCTMCDRSNHVCCARLWCGEILNTGDMKQYRCLKCRGETEMTLMAKDMECVQVIEEHETELLEMMGQYENDRANLMRDEGRTSEKLAAELEKMKISCGIYHRYYYADLIGEDARRLTRHVNAVRLWDLVENPQIRELGVSLFDAIHDIFTLLHTGYQSDNEIEKFESLIDRIQSLWSELHPSESVTLKMHALVHISESMRKEGHGGREIELVENAHHVLNTLLPRYITITPMSRRIAIIVNRFNSKRYLLA